VVIEVSPANVGEMTMTATSVGVGWLRAPRSGFDVPCRNGELGPPGSKREERLFHALLKGHGD
jgi:hypothetical protein